MKKMWMIILLGLLAITILSGCDSKELTDLQRQITALEQQIIELEALVENSEIQLEAYEERIDSLEASRLTSRQQITSLETRLESLEAITSEEVQLFLAPEYYLVPGETFQLFYRSIIQAVNPYRYYIRLDGTVGHGYNRYYEWTPEESDNGKTYTLTIDICTDAGSVLKSATTLLKVKKPATTTSKRILCIGDSLTANGYWVSHGYSQYLANGGTAHTFLGTISGGYQSTIKYEGRGGWQWSSYVGGYGEIDSPFKAATASGISFTEYCTKNGYSGIDELYILMSWNGIGGSFRTFSMATEPFYSAKKLIDQFHADYPNGKVTLLGIPEPSVNSGLGAYYTINSSYGDNYGQFVTALRYNAQLAAFAAMEGYSTFMRYVDVKAQFDSEYNMPSVTKPVNATSSTTELVGTAMGMHPSTAGYLQIGNVFYRVLSQGWGS